MNIDQITALLATLTGQSDSSGGVKVTELEKLQQLIAESLVNQESSDVRNQEFIFEKSDLVISNALFSEKLKKISKEIKFTDDKKVTTNTQVFIRNVPIRSTQINGSTTLAAAGARAKTIGPVTDIHGLPHWIDFVTVKKLIALYIQGQSKPVLLFDATFKHTKLQLANAKPVELTKTYTIDPDSVWIQAKVFSTDIPDELYCGLRVKGGTITLDKDPFMAGSLLTVSTNTKITCDLLLEQNDSFTSDHASPYGKDARNATFQLPDKLKFSYKNSVKNILVINDANWKIYGQENKFSYQNVQNCVFNGLINRVAIPLHCQNPGFKINDCQSPFLQLDGSTNIKNSWWALSVTKLDVTNPLEADGNGAIIVECEKGLNAKWTYLQNKPISLTNPFILGVPGRISIADLKSDGSGAFQQYDGWKDERNIYGTTLGCKYNKDALIILNIVASGDEMILGLSDWDIKTDRPVKVNGEAVAVKTKKSPFIIAVSKIKTWLMVIDENILWDNKLPSDKIPHVKPYALAMHNALFTVTPPNSLVLFAESTPELKVLTKGQMYLGFGLFSYLPTLPDPYAANLGILNRQFEAGRGEINAKSKIRVSNVWLWLIGLVKWEKQSEDKFKIGVSFHFAPLTVPLKIEKETISDDQNKQTKVPVSEVSSADMYKFFTTQSTDNLNISSESTTSSPGATTVYAMSQTHDEGLLIDNFNISDFSLLDVSSKANQMGVSFTGINKILQNILARQYKVDIQDETNASIFPVQVSGLDVITAGFNAQAFTVPAISWEPVFNLSKPERLPGIKDPVTNVPFVKPFDPAVGFNYYRNDGLPTFIGNLSKKQVPLSPIPLSKFLVETYKDKKDGKTFAIFNLPFGMMALTVLNNNSNQAKKPTVEDSMPIFPDYINGGIQLELTAGTTLSNYIEDDMFEGMTIQLLNINDLSGKITKTSTLGGTPTEIFNNEFFTNNDHVPGRTAVPLKRVGLSGYGASMFSDWHNRDAVYAQTSQAEFNVITGRTSHEVVQVVSMLYPWGIRVVRTITLFRLANGYVARIDSGWKAETNGVFDFDYKDKNGIQQSEPFHFYPGVVRGLFNIRNIHEQPKQFKTNTCEMQSVTFDADVELENITEGGESNRVPSKGIQAYLQIKPSAAPISESDFGWLLKSEKNSIGGQISCVMKVANTPQRMNINRFDVSVTVDESSNIVFVCAARGSVQMPKDGSWTMVQHARGSGDVTPLPEQMSVPIIRVGKWVKNKVVADNYVTDFLIQVAHPENLLKLPDIATINFGFLQNMGTQKVLFMKPTFKKGIDSLLSKTPPLLADSFRLLNSNGIFPNIGNIEDNFGQAISLLKGIEPGKISQDVFNKISTLEGGDMFNLLKLNEAIDETGKLLDQGYELAKGAVGDVLNKALQFDLPSFDYPLVDLDGKLVIKIQYKASSKPKNEPQKDYVGKFDFDIDSFAPDLADTWKGRMNNLAMVVSIGPLTDVMTIKGNFNSQKGKDVDLGSGIANELPTPEIEFSDALQPVIDILELLASLSSGDYADTLKKGLKIAMSNSANIWEYKFEASKDISLVRFPPTDELYNSPQTPLKLEASLGIGVSFNAALKVTTDPSQLLPTAGGFFKFHGGLQVMCLTIGAGSIYAVGNVDLKLEADTSPKIAVTLKFGFGAQITVGFPVVGHASILFMVGVEVYADSSSVVKVTAFMYFRGEAELLGGIVSITITIEARGTVEKTGSDNPTNCIAQVTFAIDISIFWIIDISFSESWEESRQIS